jgi:hypothetical protein
VGTGRPVAVSAVTGIACAAPAGASGGVQLAGHPGAAACTVPAGESLVARHDGMAVWEDSTVANGSVGHTSTAARLGIRMA